MILLNIANTILWIYIILKMLVQYDTVSELNIILKMLVQYDTMSELIVLIDHTSV